MQTFFTVLGHQEQESEVYLLSSVRPLVTSCHTLNSSHRFYLKILKNHLNYREIEF